MRRQQVRSNVTYLVLSLAFALQGCNLYADPTPQPADTDPNRADTRTFSGDGTSTTSPERDTYALDSSSRDVGASDTSDTATPRDTDRPDDAVDSTDTVPDIQPSDIRDYDAVRPSDGAGRDGDVRKEVGGSDSVDGGIASLRPELIYVARASGELVFVDKDNERHSTGVTGNIRAIGPSLHFDSDGVREIPYAIAANGSTSLKVVEIRGGATQRLASDIMTHTTYSHLAVAEVDDNDHPDIVYPKSGQVLAHVDASSMPPSPQTIVDANANGPDAKVRDIMGAVDLDDDGLESIYWVGTGSNFKYVDLSRPDQVQTVSNSYPIGSNSGSSGVGAPRTLGGTLYWPVVNGSNNPGVVEVGTSQFEMLENTPPDNVKSPVALADVANGPRDEIVSVAKDGCIMYVSTRQPGQASAASALRERSQQVLEADTILGVTSGYATAPMRLNSP